MRSRRRLGAGPSTRLGGPIRQKLKPLEPKRTAKAGIISGGGHNEAYRCSPYMFYHGEEFEYEEEEGVTNPAASVVDKGKKAPKPVTPPPKSPRPEGEDGDETVPIKDPRDLFATGVSSPPLHLPVAKLSELDDYDDEFSGGAVVSFIRDLKERRKRMRQRKFNDMLERPCPDNMLLLQQRLIAEIHNDDGTVPLIRKEHLAGLLKETYGFESEMTLELIGKELDTMNEGAVPFLKLMELLDKYVSGEHRMRTITACFHVFDVDERRTLTLRRLKLFRAAKRKDLYGTSGATFAMIKAILDLWIHEPGMTETLTFQQFIPFFDEHEFLVQGFLEEVFRQILIFEFKYAREALIPPDPPTLRMCHEGLVPGFDRGMLSAIPRM